MAAAGSGSALKRLYLLQIHDCVLTTQWHRRFMERGYKTAQERLVKTAVEGHAWQADHIVPVYRGGGRCGLENLRTLCTPCHADVTKQQAKDRAAMR